MGNFGYFIGVILLIIIGGAGYVFLKPGADTESGNGTASEVPSDLSGDYSSRNKSITVGEPNPATPTTGTKTSETPKGSDTSGSSGTGSSSTQAEPTPTPVPTPVPQPKTVTVNYTSSGFSPSSVTISKGDKVKFVNQKSGGMWVASNNHPTHTIYSEFDARTSIVNGGNYEFTFDKIGTWNYHDHLSAGNGGSVTVQ